MLSMIANCEKSSTRWPSERSLGRSLARSTSLPEAESIASRASASPMPRVTDSSTPRIRKGWLQHLRSSICTLSSEGSGACSRPETSTSRRASSTARYIFFWSSVISTHTTVSSSGASESSPLSTSPLRRRSKYGRMASRSSSTWSAAVSVPKRSRNASSDGKSSGSSRLSSAHSSVVLFCSGVPVSMTVYSALTARSSAATAESLFLRRCASSTTITRHGMAPSSSKSSRSVSYDVSSTWNRWRGGAGGAAWGGGRDTAARVGAGGGAGGGACGGASGSAYSADGGACGADSTDGTDGQVAASTLATAFASPVASPAASPAASATSSALAVRCQPPVRVELVAEHELARLAAAVVQEHVEVSPVLNLALPVCEGRQRCDDQEGATDVLRLPQVLEQRDGLRRLAQPHLVGEHHVASLVPREEQPVEPFDLVRPERAPALVSRRGEQRAEVRRGWAVLRARGDSELGRRRRGARPLAPRVDGALEAEHGHAALPRRRGVREPAPLDEPLGRAAHRARPPRDHPLNLAVRRVVRVLALGQQTVRARDDNARPTQHRL
eukprot:scaffold29246_cov66-Phaeocystis_antarctica.AAC.7